MLIICFIYPEDEYPYFSDPLKQLAFEKKRIYIKEESGERTLVSGGGSYTENLLSNVMSSIVSANPLSYILLDKDSDKKQSVDGNIQYWYNFEINRNNQPLTEIDFLSIIGLEDEVDAITLMFEKDIENY